MLKTQALQYAMLCTAPEVCLALSFGKGVQSKLSLTKEIFLGYGGDKEFVVKNYVDASFDTNLDDSKSRYVLNVGAISQSSSMQSIVDIEICKKLTDLNVADPLTKLLSQAKHDHTLVLFGH